MTKVLVNEKIGDSGVQLLRDAGFDVELGTEFQDGEFDRRIGEFDGLLIRSATKVTADVIEKADNLKAIGRAGVGVDNVDVDAATKRGIVVANAPQSNVVTAAEHTMALLTALARNVPQAHQSLVEGRWDRSKYSGIELYDKTLGIMGFGRIGQLVAERARAFGMRVLAFDAYVAEERFRELGAERADTSDQVYAEADFITVHLPKTPETENWLDAEAFAKMKDACGRRGPAGRPGLGQGGRRRAGRVPVGAHHRPPAVLLPQRDRDPAPGRFHGRGHRPRRLPGRRAGRGRPDRRDRDHRGQRPRRRG
jgi:D-3-phosphoglycerate dehydrogenase